MLSGKAVTPLDLKSSIVSLKLAFKYYGFVNLQIVVIFIKSSNTAVLGAPIFLLYLSLYWENDENKQKETRFEGLETLPNCPNKSCFESH